ncbi:tankyrase-2-like [Papaver somniferum]|uniref:tankyrase-2-like n=1 Tax=Papaver somniferum TaxID=3469 RepID=UPI000E6F7B93|nr:tankyrase-2-like [Papaver somniferum]
MGNPNTNTNYRKKRTPSSGGGGGGGGGEEDLHRAARTGDIHAVQSIIASNPLTVNSRDKHSRTPLHLAAWSGHNEVVSYLCKNKADVRAAAMDDMGAIHFAAQKGHLEVVRTLLSSGASVKSCNRKGLTPLHYAVQGSHIELAKYLVRKHSSLSVKTKAGKTPLDLTNDIEIRSCLVELEKCSKEEKKEETDSKQSTEEKPLGSPGNNQNVKEGNDEKDPEPSTKENSLQTLGPVVEDVSMQDERQDKETGNVKRKGDVVEMTGEVSGPKKAKIALNHLLGADDDAQEEENL